MDLILLLILLLPIIHSFFDEILFKVALNTITLFFFDIYRKVQMYMLSCV